MYKKIYKLKFHTEVHFGNGDLNTSDFTIGSDTLFSALYIEALKIQKEKEFYNFCVKRQIVISSGMPYKDDKLYIPKPMLRIESNNMGDSVEKKFFKKLKYIDIMEINSFLKGEYNSKDNKLVSFGDSALRNLASVRTGGDAEPYYVAVYSFDSNAGIYFIFDYESKEAENLIDDLMLSLSFNGIGGRKSQGLGKFSFQKVEAPKRFSEKSGGRFMLLSIALPDNDVLKEVINGASYSVIKRSGYIDSKTYSSELQKKKDTYAFDVGSCFNTTFNGAILDRSREYGTHAVYRYLEPMFLEV